MTSLAYFALVSRLEDRVVSNPSDSSPEIPTTTEESVDKLEELINSAIIVEPTDYPSNIVSIGKVVTVTVNREIIKMAIDGIEYARSDYVVYAINHPLVVAILGHSVGDSVVFRTTHSKMSIAKITEIDALPAN